MAIVCTKEAKLDLFKKHIHKDAISSVLSELCRAGGCL